MNLSVLRRYKPSIQSILSIAASAVLYVFDASEGTWDKSGVEGTLFVCETEPDVESGDENYCIVVLNRRGIENWGVDLWSVSDVEKMGELLILRYPSPISPSRTSTQMANSNSRGAINSASVTGGLGGPSGDNGKGEKVMGLWMHEDGEGTRDKISSSILSCWEKAKVAKVHAAELAARGMRFGDESDETFAARLVGAGGGGGGEEFVAAPGTSISMDQLFGSR